MEPLIGAQIRHLDPQEIFHRAGDVVTFTHLGGGLHRALKGFLYALCMLRQADSQICCKANAQRLGGEHSTITRDNTRTLKRLHPARTGRGAKGHAFGKVKIADPPLSGQNAQYLAVFLINYRHLLQVLSKLNKDCNFIAQITMHSCAMTPDLILALILFAFASSITPGPNNIMLLASGANFGLRRTVPHMLGISGGHALMVALVGLGLLQLFLAIPWLKPALMIASAAYLLWLAWKIANAAPPGARDATGRPFSFVQAAAFQWVNPKAWYMAIYAQTNFAPEQSGYWGALAVALVFAVVNLPSVTVWAAMGTQLRRWLDGPGRLRAFNITMALLLVASLYPMLGL